MSEELRVGENRLSIAGVIKSSDLVLRKREEYKDGVATGNFYTVIGGHLTIKCKDSEVKLNVNVKELTSKGEESKTFTNLKGLVVKDLRTKDKEIEMKPTIPTMVSVAKKSEEELSQEEIARLAQNVIIRGNGDFQPNASENAFVNKDFEVITNVQFNLGFGNVKFTEEPIPFEEQKAELVVDVLVKEVEAELVEAEETGRTVLVGVVPMFGGKVMPIKTIAPTEVVDEEGETVNMAEQVLDGVSDGDSLQLYLDINYISKVEKVKKKADFSRAKVEDKITKINELLLTGAMFLSEDKEFDEDLIDEALKQRKIYHKELIDKKKAEEDGGNKKGLQGSKGGNKTTEKKDKPKFLF